MSRSSISRLRDNVPERRSAETMMTSSFVAETTFPRRAIVQPHSRPVQKRVASSARSLSKIRKASSRVIVGSLSASLAEFEDSSRRNRDERTQTDADNGESIRMGHDPVVNNQSRRVIRLKIVLGGERQRGEKQDRDLSGESRSRHHTTR